MSKKIIVLFLSFITIFFVVVFFKTDSSDISEKSKLAHEICLKTAQEFKSKYNLQFLGIGQSNDQKKIKTLILDFRLDDVLSKNEARNLLLKCVDEFVDNVNKFNEIQPFLANVPFTKKNIDLTIFFSKEGTTLVDPDISCISFAKQVIEYRTRNPKPPHLFNSLETEVLEDGLLGTPVFFYDP